MGIQLVDLSVVVMDVRMVVLLEQQMVVLMVGLRADLMA